MTITSDLYGFNSHLPKPYLLRNLFSHVLSLHIRTRSWSPNHSSELVLRHGAFSLSGILGHHGPWTAYQKEPHPFEQDNSGRLNRPPPPVGPPSILGWTPLATPVPATQICLPKAASSQDWVEFPIPCS